MNKESEEVIRLSYKHKWSHIPSALSMYSYISALFDNNLIDVNNCNVVVGKPHGSQAYYIAWKRAGLIKTYKNLTTSLKYGEIPFVDYTIDILGDALGVGAGISYHNDKMTWVNIGDGALQMGNTLEAIMTIGHKKINNLILTIDYNNAQRCGSTDSILNVDPVIDFMRQYNWDVHVVDGHDKLKILSMWHKRDTTKPTAYIYNTIKGYGCNLMINNIMEWHYKTLDEKDLRQIFS